MCSTRSSLPAIESHIDEVGAGRTVHWVGAGILRVELAAYRSGMPDCRVEIDALVAQGDEVAASFRVTGTNSAQTVVEPLAGVHDEEIEPTNLAIEGRGWATFRVENAKIAAADFAWQLLGPIQQIRLFATRSLNVRLSGQEVTIAPNETSADR